MMEGLFLILLWVAAVSALLVTAELLVMACLSIRRHVRRRVTGRKIGQWIGPRRGG